MMPDGSPPGSSVPLADAMAEAILNDVREGRSDEELEERLLGPLKFSRHLRALGLLDGGMSDRMIATAIAKARERVARERH